MMKVNPSNGVPIYRQIVDQIKYRIADGTLRPEDSLPSVRQLALQLRVNPNTIVKVYSELEHEGLIYKRHGQGTFVAGKAARMSQQERRRIVGELMDRAISEGINLGFSDSELEDVFAECLSKLRTE